MIKLVLFITLLLVAIITVRLEEIAAPGVKSKIVIIDDDVSGDFIQGGYNGDVIFPGDAKIPKTVSDPFGAPGPFEPAKLTAAVSGAPIGIKAKPVLDGENDDEPTVECPLPIGPPATACNGLPGRDGMPGRDGNPGIHGVPGLPGSKGEAGQCDCREEVKRITQSEEFFVPNIHQCAWNKLNYALTIGQVQTCTFNKKRSHTSLKVGWYGTTRILCKAGISCCNRWYFTFNGGECSSPQPVDGLIFVDDYNATINIHRSMSVVGICSDIPKGPVDVGFWIGACEGEYEVGKQRTGWNSVSRIIVEEIPIY